MLDTESRISIMMRRAKNLRLLSDDLTAGDQRGVQLNREADGLIERALKLRASL